MSGHTGSTAILGLKVEGDRLLETGHRGALIEKVKKGSIADVEGQLRPGVLQIVLIYGSKINLRIIFYFTTQTFSYAYKVTK